MTQTAEGTITEQPVEFQSNGLRLLGMLYSPDEAARAGVVFCNPFGEERKSGCRMMVTAARALAREGFAVLRFDYGGCGDSEGAFRDADVRTRLSDIARAREVLCERGGVDRIGLLGLRFGAALAARAAEDGGAFLVLWEPIVAGGAYLVSDLRKKLIKEMMTAGRTSVNRKQILEDLQSGKRDVDFDGYLISGALYREMEELDLRKQVAKFTGPVLIVQISFNEKLTRPNEALRDHYASIGAPVDLVPIVAEPFWNRIDLVECPELLSTTSSWLREKA